jgi:hypothetical protein
MPSFVPSSIPYQGIFLSHSHDVSMITKDLYTYSIRILRQE